MNNTLPDNYILDQNLDWESFDVNEDFDDSYERLNFNDIEYKSDIVITYLSGGGNLTVERNRQRRIVLQINRDGHHAYPYIYPGDGYLFTVYNDDLGTAQLGTKPVRLVLACEDYLIFRGYDVLALGPFGVIDPGNTDYGVAMLLNNSCISKVVFYRYDTMKSYEYADTINRCNQLPLNLSSEAMAHSNSNISDNYLDVNYTMVERNADAFKRKFTSMSLQEKMHLANETDRIFNVGAKYWRDGNRSIALKYFADALRVFPINTDVIGIYGDYYEYSDYDLSMKFYELAIRLNSTRKKDYYQLANFYKWKGNYEAAHRCYALWDLVEMRSGIEND